MKYHDKATYCSACLKPCEEFRFRDGDGVHVWTGVLSDCCHESLTTRREALENYAWIRQQREVFLRRRDELFALVDGIIDDMRDMRQRRECEDPLHRAMEALLCATNETYKHINGR